MTKANRIQQPFHLLPIAVIAAALLLPAFARAVETGDAAPDFSLPRLRASDGAEVRLADFRGKVVYVDFWASWCPPCLVSIPLLNELRDEYVAAGKAFEVVAINVDSDPEDGIDFLLDEPVNYVVVSDPEGRTPALYGVPGMPTSYLVDAQGRVRLVHTGFKRSDIELIEAEVVKLLAEIE
jgi:thiol-disulfide isomerase/thioredoxin